MPSKLCGGSCRPLGAAEIVSAAVLLTIFLNIRGTHCFSTTTRVEGQQQHNESSSSSLRLQFDGSEFHPDPCLLRCKDDYHNQLDSMDSISWNLLTSGDSLIRPPLNNLLEFIQQEGDRRRVKRRLADECRTLDGFLACLLRCNVSEGRHILVSGQEILKTICEEFRENGDFVEHVLPCISGFGREMVSACYIEWTQVETLVLDMMRVGRGDSGHLYFIELCRRMMNYDECQIKEVTFLCTNEAWYFPSKLNAKSSLALLNMLMKWTNVKQLPGGDECEWWQPSAIEERVHSAGAKTMLMAGSEMPLIAALFFFHFCIRLIFDPKFISEGFKREPFFGGK